MADQTFTEVQPINQTFENVQPVTAQTSQPETRPDYAVEPQQIGPFAAGLTKSQAAAITNVLPTAGAVFGGLAGEGWASIPGAALGGAAGKALQQLTNRWLGVPSPETSGQAAKQIGIEGAEQGGMQAAGIGIAKGASALAKPLVASAGASLGKVFYPTKIADKTIIQKAMPRLLDEAPIALTRKGLTENIGKSLKAAGQELDAALANIPGSTPIPPQRMQQVANGLRSHAKGLMVEDIHGNLVVPPTAEPVVGLYNDMANFVENAKPTFENIRKTRQIFDGLVDKSGNWNLSAAEGSIKEIQRGLANDLRSALAKTGGQAFQDANRNYSYYKGLQQVLEHTAERTTGQQGNLTKRILTAGGFAHGGISGAMVMRNLAQLMDSTAWNTISSATKSKLADALATDNLDRAVTLMGQGIKQVATPSLPDGWNFDDNGRPVRVTGGSQ